MAKTQPMTRKSLAFDHKIHIFRLSSKKNIKIFGLKRKISK